MRERANSSVLGGAYSQNAIKGLFAQFQCLPQKFALKTEEQSDLINFFRNAAVISSRPHPCPADLPVIFDPHEIAKRETISLIGP